MKTLHASAIAKLVSNKKIGDVKDLLILLGPDTDIILLLQKLIDIRNSPTKHSEINAMITAVFRAACLHYPAQTEAFLRQIDSEFDVKDLLYFGETYTGYVGNKIDDVIWRAYRNYRKSLEPNFEYDTNNDSDSDFNSIITAECDKIIGKVAHEKWVPALEDFFSQFKTIYIRGNDDDVLEPFEYTLRYSNILKKKKEYELRSGNVKPPKIFIVDVLENKVLSIMTKNSDTKKSDKVVSSYTITPIKDWFEKLANIDLIIRKTSEFSEVDNGLHPTFYLRISFNPAKVGFTQNNLDTEGILYNIASYRCDISVECVNGMYMPVIPTISEQRKSTRIYCSIMKRSRMDPRYKGFYSVHNSVFESYYLPQVIDFLNKIVKECGPFAKVKAPAIIEVNESNPLLRRALSYCELPTAKARGLQGLKQLE